MGIEFDCSCGERINEFTRSEGGEFYEDRVACPDCNAYYVVTITQLTGGEE